MAGVGHLPPTDSFSRPGYHPISRAGVEEVEGGPALRFWAPATTWGGIDNGYPRQE